MNTESHSANDIASLMTAHAYEKAEAGLRKLLLSGGPIELWKLLANAVKQQGRIRETLDIQKMLIQARPGDLSLRFDLAETLLLLGEFTQGWREYHYRYSLPHTIRIERKVQVPRWAGQPIEGNTLLVHDEQGYGDTLQFIRLLKIAKARSNARIILQIDRDLLSFAERMKVADSVITREALPSENFDFHCEMMSLPMAINLQLSELPTTTPYITADSARVQFWKERLAPLSRPFIAVAWAGRPTHPNDANRSMPLATLAPLGASGATFLSIQKGPAANEAKQVPEGMHLVNLSEEIRDFEDTAAILAVADLLISVDSSPVHLAGALGRPVWVMLPFIPDWRWLMEREDSPWYPSMKLFRQKSRGEWSDVISRMASELEKWRNTP